MKRTARMISAIICFLPMFAGYAAEKNMPPHPSLVKQQSAVPQEFICTLFEGKTENELCAFLSTWGVESVRALNKRLFLVHLERDVTVDELRSAAKGSLIIERIQPNYRYKASPETGPVK